MIEANSNCPKCGKGKMTRLPTTVPLIPDFPEANKLRAQCPECSYEDTVFVRPRINQRPEDR